MQSLVKYSMHISVSSVLAVQFNDHEDGVLINVKRHLKYEKTITPISALIENDGSFKFNYYFRFFLIELNLILFIKYFYYLYLLTYLFIYLFIFISYLFIFFGWGSFGEVQKLFCKWNLRVGICLVCRLANSLPWDLNFNVFAPQVS